MKNDITEREWLSQGHKAYSLQGQDWNIAVQPFLFFFFPPNSHISIPHYLWSPSAQAKHVRWAMTFFFLLQKQHFLVYSRFVSMACNSEAPDFFFFFSPSAAHVPDSSPELFSGTYLHHYHTYPISGNIKLFHLVSSEYQLYWNYLGCLLNAYSWTYHPHHNEFLAVEFENRHFK